MTDREDGPDPLPAARLTDAPPVRPLGHGAGMCYLISAAGELRVMSAEKLERGRGVEELFLGDALGAVPGWVESRFRGEGGGVNWTHAGRWLMRRCSAAGLYDQGREMRSTGTWRDDSTGGAIAHVGDALISADGTARPLHSAPGGPVWVAAPPTARPAERAADIDDMGALVASIQSSWGFDGPRDAELLIGWVGVALGGAHPNIRPRMQITGLRGSGKTELLTGVVAPLMGPMAERVLNDATEAGLRQMLNGKSVAVILDEAEGGSDGSRLDSVMALSRRRYGGDGGQVVRGGSDHSAHRFTNIGATLMASVIPPPMTAADASRTIAIELGRLPRADDPAAAGRRLAELRAEARELGPEAWRRALHGSARWDKTEAQIKAEAQALGADPREAATMSAILTGRDVMMHDGAIDAERLAEARELLVTMIARAAADDQASEGERCLGHLLGAMVWTGHNYTRSLAELLADVAHDGYAASKEHTSALGRTGLRVIGGGGGFWVASGPHPQLTRAMAGTRWVEGGHRAALASLPGVTSEPNPQRIGGRKIRVLRLPTDYLPSFKEDEP